MKRSVALLGPEQTLLPWGCWACRQSRPRSCSGVREEAASFQKPETPRSGSSHHGSPGKSHACLVPWVPWPGLSHETPSYGTAREGLPGSATPIPRPRLGSSGGNPTQYLAV